MKTLLELIKSFTNLTQNTKQKYRYLMSIIILFTLYFFSEIYLFNRLIPETFSKTTFIILFILFWLILSIVTDNDTLYSGKPEKNNFVKCFQKFYPSNYLIEKLKIDSETAQYLWFTKAFNTWADKNHKRYGYWKSTLERGFMCRFVYINYQFFKYVGIVSLIINLVLIFFILTGLVTTVEFVDTYLRQKTYLSKEIIFMLSCGLISSIIYFFNKSKEEKCQGAFKRFNEINQQNIHWLEENIDEFKGYLSNKEKSE